MIKKFSKTWGYNTRSVLNYFCRNFRKIGAADRIKVKNEPFNNFGVNMNKFERSGLILISLKTNLTFSGDNFFNKPNNSTSLPPLNNVDAKSDYKILKISNKKFKI